HRLRAAALDAPHADGVVRRGREAFPGSRAGPHVARRVRLTRRLLRDHRRGTPRPRHGRARTRRLLGLHDRRGSGPFAGRPVAALVLLKEKSMLDRSSLALGVLVLPALVSAQTPPQTPDVPAKYERPTGADDYVKREVM